MEVHAKEEGVRVRRRREGGVCLDSWEMINEKKI